METLEFIKKPVDGKIVIEVPENWEGKEIVIKMREHEQDPRNWAKLPDNERVKILRRFARTAKFPNTQTDKYEVYEQ